MLTAFLILVIIGLGLALWAAWIEPRRVLIKRYEVQLHNLSAPMRAVVIGDLQPNIYHWPAHRMQALFERLHLDEKPDLVLWLGDYYNAHTDFSKRFMEKRPKLKAWIDARMPMMDEIAEAMGALKAPMGSFAVLGNHDWAWSGDETTRHLNTHGISVLQDEIAHPTHPHSGEAVQILGYADISSGQSPDYEGLHPQLNPDCAQIGLSHSPDAFTSALGGPALMLSGHTHGGQVRFPFVGALVINTENRDYDRGWFSDRHRRLFVTAGLGTSLPPVRFMCPPEVVVFDFIPDPNAKTTP